MTENGAISWTNERRKLRDLVPWDHNPREINTREAERLGDSLVEFGQIQTIAIGADGSIYDGHQRKLVWSILPQFGADYEVDVRVSSRALTERERQKLVVYLHKGTAGEWDWEELANSFEVGDLMEWGFKEGELIGWGYGDTATDRDGQGVSSTWDQVSGAESGRVIIGDIETRVPQETIDKVTGYLTSEYERARTPIFETAEALLVAGLQSVADSHS